MDREVKLFMSKLSKVNNFESVNFVILFGSRADNTANKMSDYDFAVYFEGNEKRKFRFLLDSNFDEKFDVKIFQDLPLFIRKDVLKGKIVYVKDFNLIYDVAYQTIKEFESFKKYYYNYIYYEEVK